MSAIDALLQVHVAAGAVALATFLVPIVAAKGGQAHRLAGWAFVSAMAVICTTAFPVSVLRATAATSPGAELFSKGALFVTLLSGAAVWKGMRVLRYKGSGRHRHPADFAVSALMITAGLWALVLGLGARNLILMFFGPFAALGGLADLRYWLNPDKPRMHWFFAHMGGMMGASVAALTAFAFFGARRLGEGTPGVAMFVGPTLVLMPVLFFMRRHYERKYGLRAAPVGAPRGAAPRTA